jgi:arginine N-succinyltransferase
MPKHPVYTAMLPETARAVIGLPHPSGRAAMRMLENEGFAYERYVDIFDGGPTMTARTDQIRSVREAQEAAVTDIVAPGGEPALVATGRLTDFRCCCGTLVTTVDGVAVDAGTARLLGVEPGATVLYAER